MASPELIRIEDQPVEVVAGTDTVDVIVARRRIGVGFVLAAIWLGLLIAAALLADVLPLLDPNSPDPLAGRQGPSADHWLGADQLGRDILSRLIYGARTSLAVGVLATLLSGVVGMLLGLVSGYFRGFSENVTMGAIDVLLSFPALMLAIALTAVLGGGTRNVIIAIAVLTLPAFARIARAETLIYAEREFVKAARTLGARRSRILFREIGPNILPTMAAYGLVIIAVSIVTEATLSFLGLGVPPSTPTWGGMISQGRPQLEAHPHITFIPAAVMFLTVLTLNTLGERLRERHEDAGGREA